MLSLRTNKGSKGAIHNYVVMTNHSLHNILKDHYFYYIQQYNGDVDRLNIIEIMNLRLNFSLLIFEPRYLTCSSFL